MEVKTAAAGTRQLLGRVSPWWQNNRWYNGNTSSGEYLSLGACLPARMHSTHTDACVA